MFISIVQFRGKILDRIGKILRREKSNTLIKLNSMIRVYKKNNSSAAGVSDDIRPEDEGRHGCPGSTCGDISKEDIGQQIGWVPTNGEHSVFLVNYRTIGLFTK